MKKLLPLLIFSIISNAVIAQNQYPFLDDKFAQYIVEKYPAGCLTFIPPNYDTIPERFESGYIMNYPVCDAISNEDSLDLSGTAINYFEGLESFTSLQYLDLSWTSIYSSPPLPKSVKTFKMNHTSSSGSYTYLPKLSDSLVYFDCSWNSIPNLPALPPALTYLNCSYQDFDANNILIQLPSLPPSLIYLDCSGNGLTSLPSLPVSLTYLNCSGNSRKVNPEVYEHTLKQLPPLPPSLKYLYCGNNALERLPALPDSLLVLNCSGNTNQTGYNVVILYTLDSLPFLPNSLKALDCGSNKIDFLPKLPESLDTLHCAFNKLTSLPELPNTLKSIECMLNNIVCLPKLPVPPNSLPKPISIKFDKDKIPCVPNSGQYDFTTYTSYIRWDGILTYDFILHDKMPICNLINNINHCQSFPVIKGTVFYDHNNNLIKDSNEFYKANVQLQLSNGSKVYTDNNGYFEIAADSTTSYTLSVNPPYYLTAIPATSNYTFTTYDTSVVQDIVLQSSITLDSASINITPILWAARPGFNYNYSINYENTGTNTLSPTINFNYDNTKLSYIGSSNPNVINNAGNLILADADLLPGEKRSFLTNFKVKTNVVLGSNLTALASIYSGDALSIDSITTIISGAFDPNDKKATPQLSPQQVNDGKYIDYTIRFQNTGNDTAFNIVITDTLSNLLQPGTLEILNSSHPCKTTLTGNKIYFEFLNVLLPDSNVNEPASHGFINFKIKPHASVTIGTSIPNKAFIYFDYNTPILTNTANTLIQNSVLSVQVYYFIGNGNWSNATNWSNNIIPPANLANGAQIIIDPAGNGECILDVPQVIGAGSIFTIKAGKKFRATGNLLIQ